MPPVLRSRTRDTSPIPPHSQYTHTSRVAGRRIIRRREGKELANPLTEVAILGFRWALFRSAVHFAFPPNRRQVQLPPIRHPNKSGVHRICPQWITRVPYPATIPWWPAFR